MNKWLPRALAVVVMVPALSWAAAAEYASRIELAIEVLHQTSKMPEQAIPDWLLRDAEGIAVIPGVVKAGFVVGGRRGHGVLSIRDSAGHWSAPTFVTLTGGSVGFQAGVQSSDVVLVFRSRRSVKDVVRGKFTLGGDASVAAGPVGRSAEAATDTRLTAEILAYSRARGLFAGISLDGSALRIDHDANEALYGGAATPGKIFAGQVGAPPAVVNEFRDLLSQLAGDH